MFIYGLVIDLELRHKVSTLRAGKAKSVQFSSLTHAINSGMASGLSRSGMASGLSRICTSYIRPRISGNTSSLKHC